MYYASFARKVLRRTSISMYLLQLRSVCVYFVGAGSMLERTQSDSVLFTQSEIMGLRLMFSLFDR